MMGIVNSYKVSCCRNLLGSPELFFRSIFSSQNSESITSLTPGKRKELFMELLGLQRYERYTELCKVKIDALESEIAGSRGKLEQIYSETSKRPLVEEELHYYEAELIAVDTSLKILQEQITTGSNLLIVNERRIAEDQQKHSQIHDLGNEISVLEAGQWKLKQVYETEYKQLNDQRAEIGVEIGRKRKIIEHKKDIENNAMLLRVRRPQLKAWDERKSQLAEVEQAESACRLARQKDDYEYRKQVEVFDHDIILVDMEMRELNQRFESTLKERERQLINARQSAGLIEEVPCLSVPGLQEKCKLLSSAIGARDTISEIEKDIQNLKSDEYRQFNGLSELQKRVDGLQNQKRSLTLPTEFFPDEWETQKRSIGYDIAQHLQIKKQIEDLEKGNWESLLEELRLAESMIEEKNKTLTDISQRVITLSDKFNDALAESTMASKKKRITWEGLKASLLSQEDLLSFVRHKEALAFTANTQKKENERRSTILGDIQFRQEMIKKLDALKADSEAIELALTLKLTSLEHHKLLHRACSKDGIPALELDAAGPEVSRIANDLLASTFGSRFQIAFETTKLTKDKKKQIETFEIRVYGEDGEKKIEDLSGGQRVWIETALQEAIAIYLSEKSGKELLTSYQDEKDGALDPDNKQHFVEMSREAFRLGRRYYTFLITQTPDIWQQVQQRLHLHPETGTIEQII